MDMPPHCDSLDGPVVTAARQALDKDDLSLVLPYVPEEAEDEVREVFTATQQARVLGDAAREVADRLFFETVVRLHRAGEGAPYTGLKPAGLDVGPAIPLAERALESGSAEALATYLGGVLNHELRRRLDRVGVLAMIKDRSTADARAHVEAMLGFEVYSHHVLEALRAPAHGNGANGHRHE
jgi:hypothetical protein